ncbi:MAG: class I SAM-dependent methyltransferase [Thiobacillus sp.]
MKIPTDEIRARPRPDCYLCGSKGQPLYHGLEDRLFGVPGKWNLAQCPNSDCGLIWQNPMPVEEDIGKAYRSYYTHQDAATQKTSLLRRLYQRAKQGYLAQKYGYYANDTSWLDRLMGLAFYCHPGRRADTDFEVFYLDAMKGGRLLEVGCGSGTMLKAMSERGWHAEGVDFDPNAVKNARLKGLAVHLGSLSDQGFPSNAFDAIVMSHVIEHVPDPYALLVECKRILKPGAILISVTPNTNSLGHRVFKINWRGLEPPRHLHLFNSRSSLKLAHNIGFKEAEVRTTIRDANGLMIASQSLYKRSLYQVVSYQMGSPKLWTRLWGRAMQFFEWFSLKFNRTIGEELVLIAKK